MGEAQNGATHIKSGKDRNNRDFTYDMKKENNRKVQNHESIFSLFKYLILY